MKTGAMVLGIIGGLIAFGIGIVGYLFGSLGTAVGAEGSGMVKVLSLVIPIVGMVGGGMVKSKAMIGGGLMIASGVAIVIVIGMNIFSFIPAIPLCIGGVLGLMDGKESV